jgi:hypothetical protein
MNGKIKKISIICKHILKAVLKQIFKYPKNCEIKIKKPTSGPTENVDDLF